MGSGALGRVVGVKVWSPELQTWRYGMPEYCCTCADMEVWKYGMPELYCTLADVEVSSSGRTLYTYGHGGNMEVRSARVVLLAYRGGGAEEVRRYEHSGQQFDDPTRTKPT